MNILTSLFWCILGIAGGAIVTVINNKRKRLTRKMFTVDLISEKASSINGLKIKYNSQPIKNLYSTTIQIKNSGNSIINNVDIPTKCPLSIYTDGIFIIDNLNIQLPNPNNENNVHVTFNKDKKDASSSATIDFEFISQRQVIAITLLHTGNISFGKWKIKDGKVYDSNEILDETEYKSHPTLSFLKPEYLFYIAIIFIIPIIILSVITSKELNISLATVKELDSYTSDISDYINDLNAKIYSLEYELQTLKDFIKTQKNFTIPK